jgi:putative heme transporter
MVGMENEQKKPKTFRRTLQILAVGVVVYFFVLPLIPGFRQAVRDLNTINPYLLLVGIGLQGFSLFMYSLLTRAALGDYGESISRGRLFRIQLSTKALGNIVPGGSAASSALGYRLITMCGIPGPDVAFALATAGIGSAVVLNLILWFGLIISIPFRGVNAAYGSAAIVGVIFMAFAAFLIFGLLEGQGRSERIIRAIARRFRFDEQHAAEVLAHLGSRIEGLILDKKLLRKVLGLATVNWLLDAFSLWVFLRAFGGDVGFDGLIVAFGIANVFSVVPITPGGLGLVEGIYIPSLVGFGLARRTATVGVLSYRVAQYWLPIVVGWACYLSLRVGPFAIDRKHRLQPISRLAQTQTERGLSTVDWVEKYAPKDRTGQFPMPAFEPGDLEFEGDDTDGSPRPH